MSGNQSKTKENTINTLKIMLKAYLQGKYFLKFFNYIKRIFTQHSKFC